MNRCLDGFTLGSSSFTFLRASARSTMLLRLWIGVFGFFWLIQPSFYTADLFSYSLEELLEVKVRVPSLFEEGELETPSSFSVINRKDWTHRGSRKGLRDLLDFLPGVVTYSSFGGTGLAIRGFASNTNVVRGKAFLIDGIPINNLSFRTGLYGRSNLNPQIFDSLEVIRGPGSALYGADAFSGIIAMKTYDPRRNEAGFYVSSSSAKDSEFTLRASQKIGREERLSANFSVSGQGSQNLKFRSYQLLGEQTREETWQAGTALLKWSKEQSERAQKVHFTFLSHQWETDESPGFASAFAPFFGAITDNVYADTRFNFYKASLERTLSAQRTFETNLYHWSSHFGYQLDTTPPADQQIVGRRDTRTGIQFRLRQPEREGHKTRWVLGLDLDRLGVKDTYVGFLSTGVGPDNFEGLSNTVKGLFYQARTRIRDHRLYLHYGLRLDQYPGFGNQITPRLGLVYLVDPQTSWKFLYGNAFRAPTAGELQGFRGGTKGDPMIHPEEIDSYEIIYLKKGRTSKLNLTYFENRWTDGIQVDGLSKTFINFEKNRSSGLELTYRKKLGKTWNLDFSGSRISGINENTDKSYDSFPGIVLNLQGSYHVPGRPWSLWLGTRVMKDWKDGPGQVNFVSPQPLATYIRADLGLDYELSENTRIYLWIRNAFNRELKTPSILDSEIGVPEQGRSIGFGLSYAF